MTASMDRLGRTLARLVVYVVVLVGAAATLEAAGAPRLRGRVMIVIVAGIVVVEGLIWLQARVGARPGPLAPLVRLRPAVRPSTPVALDEWVGLMRSAGTDRRAGGSLRARLRELSAGVLATRRGVLAARRPAAARAALGPAAWILDDAEGGLTAAEVNNVLDHLERL
jgi:hypothetical protein